jgi:hypothetical protein
MHDVVRYNTGRTESSNEDRCPLSSVKHSQTEFFNKLVSPLVASRVVTHSARALILPSTSCLPSFIFHSLFEINRRTQLSNHIRELKRNFLNVLLQNPVARHFLHFLFTVSHVDLFISYSSSYTYSNLKI